MLKSIADIVTSVVDDFHTSDEEQGRLDIENKKLDLEKSKLKANIATQQTQINLQEAKHKSLFVAGWRPFIGWTSRCRIMLSLYNERNIYLDFTNY